MPVLIERPANIPVAGGKTIHELVGAVATGTHNVSIAHMYAPVGWTEPGQTPEFTEYTIVLKGMVVVEHKNGRLEVLAGQAVITKPGEWVRYSAGDDGAEYLAVCMPAFSPDLAHRDGDSAEFHI